MFCPPCGFPLGGMHTTVGVASDMQTSSAEKHVAMKDSGETSSIVHASAEAAHAGPQSSYVKKPATAPRTATITIVCVNI